MLDDHKKFKEKQTGYFQKLVGGPRYQVSETLNAPVRIDSVGRIFHPQGGVDELYNCKIKALIQDTVKLL